MRRVYVHRRGTADDQFFPRWGVRLGWRSLKVFCGPRVVQVLRRGSH